MRLPCILAGIAFIVGGVNAQLKPEMHIWKPARGIATVDAIFERISEKDPASVVLKAKDGRQLTVKIIDLCEEDRAYVKDLTNVSRNISVTFKQKPNSLYGVCEESGSSPTASIGDTVTLRVLAEGDTKKAESTRWTIQSADALGNKIGSRSSSRRDEMTTEGKFVFLTFTVANDSDYPVTVSSPVLIDKRGRKFLQSDKSNLRNYIPGNTALAYSKKVQPGLKELFCSVYELPLDAEPALVEVFPAMTESYVIQRFEATGKRIMLEEDTTAPASILEAPPSPSAAAKKLNITLNATKTKQTGQVTEANYYSSTKVRNYTYQVDLRLLNQEIKQANVKVKVFFTGAVSKDLNLVVDNQEKEINLDQGKNLSITFRSKDIQEQHTAYSFSYSYYYFSGTTRINAPGAQLNGIIVQVWSDTGFVKGISKGDSQLKKFEESTDVIKDMGELKQDSSRN